MLPPRYQSETLLGRGAMGEVYRAYDLERGREVAVKVLLAGGDPTLPRRFRREAEHLERARHPHVVEMLGFEESDGHALLVMEYLGGGDLQAALRQERALSVTLSDFAGVCDGLGHIHALGLVHRDVKPSNILFADDGAAKLADFGISLDAESDTATLTAAGTLLGSFEYLAPERITESHVGPAADMYGIGVCLFLAATGRLPFQAASLYALLRCHASETPPPAGRGAALDGLIAALLEKEPARRPQAAEVAATLKSLL